MSQTAKLIAEIATYIDDARELCERGAYVELNDLNERVQTICGAIAELPIEEAKEHAADLDGIMTSLEALQRVFEDKRAALGEELHDTSKHHKAAKAYTQHEMTAPKEG